MDNRIIRVMPDVLDAINGVKGRKYVTDATAKTLAIIWATDDTPVLSDMIPFGAVTSVAKLRAEIDAMAREFDSADKLRDKLSDSEVQTYSALIALDVYLSQIKGKSRKAVKGWNPALALVA